jgi:hypothetical protein
MANRAHIAKRMVTENAAEKLSCGESTSIAYASDRSASDDPTNENVS